MRAAFPPAPPRSTVSSATPWLFSPYALISTSRGQSSRVRNRRSWRARTSPSRPSASSSGSFRSLAGPYFLPAKPHRATRRLSSSPKSRPRRATKHRSKLRLLHRLWRRSRVIDVVAVIHVNVFIGIERMLVRGRLQRGVVHGVKRRTAQNRTAYHRGLSARALGRARRRSADWCDLIGSIHPTFRARARLECASWSASARGAARERVLSPIAP